MKLVKIILGVIILFSFIFFSTGFVVKEIQYTNQVSVEKPLNDVFKLLGDPENQSLWMPEINKIEIINKNPQFVGSIYRLTINNNGQNLKMKQKILIHKSNEKLTYRFNSDVIVRTEDYILSEENTQTTIIQKTRIRSLSYLFACTFPWFKSKFKENTQDNLDKLKKNLEN